MNDPYETFVHSKLMLVPPAHHRTACSVLLEAFQLFVLLTVHSGDYPGSEILFVPGFFIGGALAIVPLVALTVVAGVSLGGAAFLRKQSKEAGNQILTLNLRVNGAGIFACVFALFLGACSGMSISPIF